MVDPASPDRVLFATPDRVEIPDHAAISSADVPRVWEQRPHMDGALSRDEVVDSPLKGALLMPPLLLDGRVRSEPSSASGGRDATSTEGRRVPKSWSCTACTRTGGKVNARSTSVAESARGHTSSLC
jgi:hypothetical protein